jgi:hypothetical protein
MLSTIELDTAWSYLARQRRLDVIRHKHSSQENQCVDRESDALRKWYASCYCQEHHVNEVDAIAFPTKEREDKIMLWAIVIAGTYVAGVYLIRLVWWQE